MKYLISAIFLLLPFASLSDHKEIGHLLNFVGNTQCSFERNGKMHTGEQAVRHIKKKFDYYSEDIKTTEDFINYSATKSKMSGKHYRIHCPMVPVTNSQKWLLTELLKYRAKLV